MKAKRKDEFWAENSARLLQNLWHSTGLEIENFDSAETSKRLLDTLLVEAEIFEAGKFGLKEIAVESFKFGFSVAVNKTGDKYIFRKYVVPKIGKLYTIPSKENVICAYCGYLVSEHPRSDVTALGAVRNLLEFIGCDGCLYTLSPAHQAKEKASA